MLQSEENILLFYQQLHEIEQYNNIGLPVYEKPQMNLYDFMTERNRLKLPVHMINFPFSNLI